MRAAAVLLKILVVTVVVALLAIALAAFCSGSYSPAMAALVAAPLVALEAKGVVTISRQVSLTKWYVWIAGAVELALAIMAGAAVFKVLEAGLVNGLMAVDGYTPAVAVLALGIALGYASILDVLVSLLVSSIKMMAAKDIEPVLTPEQAAAMQRARAAMKLAGVTFATILIAALLILFTHSSWNLELLLIAVPSGLVFIAAMAVAGLSYRAGGARYKALVSCLAAAFMTVGEVGFCIAAAEREIVVQTLTATWVVIWLIAWMKLAKQGLTERMIDERMLQGRLAASSMKAAAAVFAVFFAMFAFRGGLYDSMDIFTDFGRREVWSGLEASALVMMMLMWVALIITATVLIVALLAAAKMKIAAVVVLFAVAVVGAEFWMDNWRAFDYQDTAMFIMGSLLTLLMLATAFFGWDVALATVGMTAGAMTGGLEGTMVNSAIDIGFRGWIDQGPFVGTTAGAITGAVAAILVSVVATRNLKTTA